MIRIDRNRRHSNGRVIHPGPRWLVSADTATAEAVAENGDHEAKRSVYAATRVRTALEALTYGKCAYCEVPLARFDWDVEHFRPKGRVKERPDHPGYYWLTYDWTNLLPSCTYCNQNRKERPTFDDPTPGTTGGKVDKFPIADENNRAMDHTHDVAVEEPLLLNPCEDDPELHLAYEPTGRIITLNGSSKGRVSIQILRLHLRRLTNLRRDTLDIVQEMLAMRNRTQERGEEEATQEINNILKTMADSNRQFAGMVRFFLNNPAALGFD